MVYPLGHIPFSKYFSLFQIYIMDIHIWYTVLSAIVGGVKGARARLGEVSTYFIFHNQLGGVKGSVFLWVTL